MRDKFGNKLGKRKQKRILAEKLDIPLYKPHPAILNKDPYKNIDKMDLNDLKISIEIAG